MHDSYFNELNEIDMDKYYTPSIEEFRVGFEYESNYGEGWESNIFGEFNSEHVEDIICDFRYYKVRVKHLNKQDIESLGFKEVERSVESVAYSFGAYGEYVLAVIRGFGEIMIMRNGFNLFRGKIKNLSELKVLLNQLGVEYDKEV